MKPLLTGKIALTILLLSLTASAQTWSSFPCLNTTGSVIALTGSNTELYMGGTFPDLVESYNLIYGCNGGFPQQNMQIRCMTYYNGDLYVSGYTPVPDTTKIYRLSSGGWSEIAYTLGGIVDVLGVYNNELYAGGFFLDLNGTSYNNLAKWNGNSWSDVGGGIWPSSGPGGAFVRSMTIYNGALIVGGDSFAPFANSIAKWDGNTWSSLGTGISSSTVASVFSLTEYNGNLYAAGHFNLAGSTVVANVAKWNGTAWSDPGGGLDGGDSIVKVLTVYHTELYAGGSFATAGGVTPVNNIAKYNGSSWSDVNGGVTGGLVLSMTNYYGALIVGGFFNSAGGVSVTNLAKLSGCPAGISASGSTTFCSGDSVILTATAGNAFQWLKNGSPIAGANAQSYTSLNSGIFSCLVTNSCGTVITNTIQVIVHPTPVAVITASGPTTFCAGDSVQLNVSTGTGYQYVWYKYGNIIPGAVQSVYVAKTAGKYKVWIQNLYGCINKSSPVSVTINPNPTATITAGGSTSICAGDSVVLTANTNISGSSYQWKKYANLIPGATNVQYAAKTTGKYKVIVTSPAGCTKNSKAVLVSVICRELSDESTSDQLLVYPNPVVDELTLFYGYNSGGTVIITDLSGAIVAAEQLNPDDNKAVLDVSDLAKGIYFVQLTGPKEKHITKFIKQ
ncbi:MAG TPA: T9SS type A sorting domain-containing protein [Bacteroidia bacterium]|nr:T9SS type A sorting domain-containing protein [Bacteroidia bacterium]